ncbi:hypothetical protein [Shewanella sp. ENK2]|uniref:hypothetical protein n=1 Tax=Shewanella sp. ENK2 TaxID=2775245 RepID=UPI003747E011
MSFSSSRKRALDTSRPIPYRASSARSCAVCVSEKYRVKRSVILEQVRQQTHVDLNAVDNSDGILKAISALEHIKLNGLNKPLHTI